MRFDLDKYIRKNENGYLMNEHGGLFVELDDDYIQPIGNAADTGNLKEITKDEFIDRLIN